MSNKFRQLYEDIWWRWWCIYCGLINFWRFRKVIWHWDSCDYAPTLDLMEVAFREISRLHTENGHLVSSKRTAKETFIVANLCKRLSADDYDQLAKNKPTNALNEHEARAWIKHVEYLAAQDIALLGKMFRKVQHWWD